MAREINFQPVASPNFSNSNDLLKTAMAQGAIALKTIQDSVNAFNKDVTDRHTARAKQYINSLSQEDLMNHPEMVANYINELASTTGNMIDESAINTHWDNRQDTFVNRAIKQAEQSVNTVKARDVEDDYNSRILGNELLLAKKALQNAITPQEKVLAKQVYDNVLTEFSKHNANVKQGSIDYREKQEFDALTRNNDLIDGFIKRYSTPFNELVNQVNIVNGYLSNPNLTPEQRTNLENQKALLVGQLKGIQKKVPDDVFKILTASSPAYGRKIQSEATKNRQIEADINYKVGSLQNQQEKNAIDYIKAFREDSKNTKEKTSNSELDKKLATFGLDNVVQHDDSGGVHLNIPVFVNNIGSAIQQVLQTKKGNKESFNEWMVKNAKLIQDWEKDSRSFFDIGQSDFTELANVISKDKSLSDDERIAVASAFLTNQFTSRPITGTDNMNKAISEFVNIYRTNRNQQTYLESQTALYDILSSVAAKAGIPVETLEAHILNNPNLNTEVRNLFRRNNPNNPSKRQYVSTSK